MQNAKPKRVQKTTNYINNKEFTAEIVRCREKSELSPKAIEYFILLANRVILKLKYTNALDKEDCIQSALVDLCKYWRSFDPNKSNNAFAYYTQLVKNAYSKEFKKIHKNVSRDEKVVIVSLSMVGDGDIYNI